jgi:hypothetical protein
MSHFIQIRVRRWYVALAFRVPGHAQPACLGFGLDGYESEARDAAIALASGMVAA